MNRRPSFVLGLVLLLLPFLALPLTAQQWTALGDLSIARWGAAAIYIGDGQVLVIGGSTGIPIESDPMAVPVSTCDVVDVWRGLVTSTAPMALPRAEFVALPTRDSSVVVIGGVTGIDPKGDVTGDVELYDPRTRGWRTVGTLLTARRQHVAGFIDEHRILVVGGRTKTYASLTDAEVFDLRTGTSTRATPFPYPINTSTLIVSHSGDLVVVGGRTGGANSERRSEVYAYDPATDAWVLSSVLAQSVSGVSGLRLWDRRIIVAGGLHQDLPGQSATEVQLENVGKWKLISPMSRPRTNAGLAQWTENRVLVVGGYHSDRQPVATTEWIDMSRHTSTPGPSLAVARDRFTVLSVPAAASAAPHEHAVVAIGGLRSTSDLTSLVEVLRPGAEVIWTVERDTSDRSVLVDAARRVHVAYAVAAETRAELSVIDESGRRMTMPSKVVPAGAYDDVVDMTGAPGGTYRVELSLAGELRKWRVELP